MSQWMLLFPGQGAQTVGMGSDLAAGLPECRALFDEASDVLGLDLLKLCTEGPLEELTKSRNAQPAIFVVSMAARAALAHAAGVPLAVGGTAGLSSGEWAALHEAGVISFADTVRVLRARGEFMQAACEATPGGMLTLIGLPVEKAREVAAEAGLEVANLNSPLQTVLSGHADRIPAEKGRQGGGCEACAEVECGGGVSFHADATGCRPTGPFYSGHRIQRAESAGVV